MEKQEWLSSFKFSSPRDRDLAERAYDIFMANVYTEGGYKWSPYRCTCPGKSHFIGIWNWDSAFHAIGFSRWDMELAKENIFGFFQFQEEDGYLPDCILRSGTIIKGFSKPPVFPWACELVYKRGGSNDIEFLREIYPKLVLNIDWWEKKRFADGLYAYNADNPDGPDYITNVRYESGWDNAVRWDEGITNFWAIDLNCFMVMSYRSLSFIARELGLLDEADVWAKKAEALAETINERMWDDQNKYYSDTDKFTGKVSPVMSPACFMPLYINIATKERAEAMARIAEEKFEGKMPTVSFDNPAYCTDYWRGPTWLNVAYFAAKGLKNYDLPVADVIKESILNMCDAEKGGIYENYDSRTGKGQYCRDFSWSCVFLIEFIMNW